MARAQKPDPVCGTRPLKRFLQSHIETLATKIIIADNPEASSVIVIDCLTDQLTASVKKPE